MGKLMMFGDYENQYHPDWKKIINQKQVIFENYFENHLYFQMW